MNATTATGAKRTASKTPCRRATGSYKSYGVGQIEARGRPNCAGGIRSEKRYESVTTVGFTRTTTAQTRCHGCPRASVAPTGTQGGRQSTNAREIRSTRAATKSKVARALAKYAVLKSPSGPTTRASERTRTATCGATHGRGTKNPSGPF